MRFVAGKDDLLNGIRIVERATVVKGLQPVLANVLIETIGTNQIKLTATDFDFSITTMIDANVEEEGRFTLPAKKLGDIISRLQEDLVKLELNDSIATITCKKSKFDFIGISASEFPKVEENISEEDSIEIETKPFTKAIRHVVSAAAGYETNNLLSGVVCEVNKNILEMAATDGNRLARVREVVKNNSADSEKVFEMLISSKVLSELSKISLLSESENIKISKEAKKIVITIDKTKIITKLMQGQFPKYNQLIPQSFPKEAKINKSALVSALERVAIMISEKNSIVKFEFGDDMLKLSGDSPEAGNSQDVIDIKYTGEPITIAFNYKFVLEFLKIVESEDIMVQLNTPLSATVLAPVSDEDYIYLVMPVQLRG
ncbi:MAG: DNA polymerase III subunit beta [Cyanobacteria bacterium SIG28]|nr:DNA polymerase III subunit beta [Cyanobacteria bacterium SIG28]